MFGFGGGDDTSYTSMAGAPPPPGQLAPEGVDKGQNSLTQFLRSLTNLTGEKGSSILSQGQDWLSKPASYYSGILSGKPADVAGALAPELSAASDQYEGAKRNLDQYSPAGGGRSTALAQLPFERARTQGNIISTARRDAAPELASMGSDESKMGLQALFNTIQQLMGRRGQNITEDTANKQLAGQLGSSVGYAVGSGALGELIHPKSTPGQV